MNLPPIPQNDPKAAYLAQRAAIDAAIAGVLESGWYILGKETAALVPGLKEQAEERRRGLPL